MSIRMPGVGKGKQITIDNAERKHIYTSVYNTRRWRSLRLSVLMRDNYLCQECLRKGRLTPATIADHVIPILSGGKAWDIDNIQSLCDKCHQVKTNKERK